MKVEDAKPWPELQRFDFFVRTREVSAKEAVDITKALATQTPPNHAAAQYALRELTGRTPTNATPQGWRVDDIGYGGTWDFGNKGKMTETLRMVIHDSNQ